MVGGKLTNSGMYSKSSKFLVSGTLGPSSLSLEVLSSSLSCGSSGFAAAVVGLDLEEIGERKVKCFCTSALALASMELVIFLATAKSISLATEDFTSCTVCESFFMSVSNECFNIDATSCATLECRSSEAFLMESNGVFVGLCSTEGSGEDVMGDKAIFGFLSDGFWTEHSSLLINLFTVFLMMVSSLSAFLMYRGSVMNSLKSSMSSSL